MEIISEPCTIFIKTYTFESGLWYLAKSLAEHLEKQGHTIYFIPKSKYATSGSIFHRTYPAPTKPEQFPENILPMKGDKKIDEQILNYIVKYNAKYLISFESLMEKSAWISLLKRKTGIKVIDIPMIEWVNPSALPGKQYNIFDEIWLINPDSQEHFKDYKQTKVVSWPVVNTEIFSKPEVKPETIIFYHQASLNPDFSHKNTTEVLSAFDMLVRSGIKDVELHVSGLFPEKKIDFFSKPADNEKVIKHGVVNSQAEISELYKKAHIVVAPSSKEGLGLSLYEAQACGCKVITTDASPMNHIQTEYLCKPDHQKKDNSLIKYNVVSAKTIFKQMKKAYEDIKCQTNQ